MSSLRPATVQLSFAEFSRHGGLTGPHKDGWGIAFYEGGDVRLMREPGAASDSAFARFVQEHPPASRLVLNHIRKATQGSNDLANCQPFARELGGRMHLFAHNGHLDRETLALEFPLGVYRPVGDGDSEHAFCALLDRMRTLWLRANGLPPVGERLQIVANFAREIRPLGPANFLYADSDTLFVRGHKRTHADSIHPPGLHVLRRRCEQPSATYRAEGLAIALGTERQEVVLAASVPLTADEAWQPLEEGEILALRMGEIVGRALASPRCARCAETRLL